ncbi:A24 family peptidase [Desulfopila inferna]|uniref:A24 family peptidase n=1 Tax=Desulfopila inferna TaxID=468528 RepID=UPI0019640562|nr:prepilin peptidase [Desulfopila inferna]MBM9603830.1 prepilin peptidase [Desulfopila inferna]
MNLFDSPLQMFLYCGLASILILSCYTDLSYRMIPNVLTYPTILAALLLQYLSGGLSGFLFSLSGVACGLLIFLVPYLMGGMGAGDVKLMGGVGAVLGPAHTAIALVFIALAGGVFAIGLMLKRRILTETLTGMLYSALLPGYVRENTAKGDKKDGIPYAVAITGGVFLFALYMMKDTVELVVFGI